MCTVPSGVQVKGGGLCVNALFSPLLPRPKTAGCPALLFVSLVSYKYVCCMCIFATVNNNLAFFCSWHAQPVRERQLREQVATQLRAMTVYVPEAGRSPRLGPVKPWGLPLKPKPSHCQEIPLQGASYPAHLFPTCPIETNTAGTEFKTDPKRDVDWIAGVPELSQGLPQV